jgi:hypothetical protein
MRTRGVSFEVSVSPFTFRETGAAAAAAAVAPV